MPVIAESAPPAAFDWKRWPQTETLVDELIEAALHGNAFATDLGARMCHETGTRFKDWVDHLVVADELGLSHRLAEAGFERQRDSYAVGIPVFAHPGGIFPRIALASSPTRSNGAAVGVVSEVAIKVESVADFSRAHDLGMEMVGYSMGPYRVGRVAGDKTSLAVVERRGYLGFEPFPGDLARLGRMKPHAARDALAARELWQARRRRFDDDLEGFNSTEATLERVIELAGSTDLACHLVFEVERDYWQSRNTAARARKHVRTDSAWAGRTMTTTRSGVRGGSFRA